MKSNSRNIKSKNHDGLIDQIIQEIYRIDQIATDNPVVMKKAEELRGKNKSETIKNCFDYVWKTVSYCDDPKGMEHITSPWLLITGQKKCEDCESMVLLLSSLLRINGIKTRYKVVSWKDKSDLRFTHIVLEAKDGNNWLVLDPTMKSAGFNHSVTPNREKRYRTPMESLELKTLSDKPCACNSSRRCGCNNRSRAIPEININIGNQHSNSNSNSGNVDIRQDLLQKLGLMPKDNSIVVDKVVEAKEKEILVPNQTGKGHKQLYSTVVAGDKVYKYPERY